MSIKVSEEYVKGFVSENEINYLKGNIEKVKDMLENKKGEGREFTGFVELPYNYNKEEFKEIKKASKKIQENSDILVVIGIGGSYLGARAVIELFNNSFINTNKTEVIFAGQNMSSKYLSDLLYYIKDKDISLNIISKSGTTTEPAIAFRILKKFIEEKYGKEGAKERIYATTDKEKGALKMLAQKEGYKTFVVPDDIGGRYSVLTAVGLLPIAVAGVNIDELMQGAKDMADEAKSLECDCYKYAVIRNALYRKGKTTEILVNYEPSMHYFAEWWKQLFGESEGKGQEGIYPSSVEFTTDLHSLGQYIQDGVRNLFETVIKIGEHEKSLIIPKDEEDLDGLNYLAGKTMNEVNEKAMEGTIKAHIEGGVPNIIISIEKIMPYDIGQMIYFFEKACGISGYLLGVNPFNQPGVEMYKKNMFQLLKKLGY